MKRALISDVHANLEALQAVLADIRAQDVSDVYCLGDVIGLGPNPCECLDEVIKCCSVTILGDFDQAALSAPDGFSPVALRAVYWMQNELESGGSPEQINSRQDFLGELPRMRQEDDFLFVHGSPREPTNEYVFPEDIDRNPQKMDALFSRVERCCFQGHTHLPGVFTTEYREFLTPEDGAYQYRLSDEKVMINVGSVGQPRDNDPRACYVTFEDGLVTFRRVDYDVDTTVNKISNIPDLDNMLGDRLRSGR